MTEKQLRQSVADAALAWLGRREKGGGHREILAVYNAITPLPVGYRMKDTDPWCAAFVSAAAAKAGLTAIVFPECSCPRMVKRYKAAGRWEEVDFAVPRVGDVIFYDWNGDRAADHVGLVIEAAGDYLTAIEGNKSDAVGKRRVHLDDKHILGYGQPDYFHYAEKTGSEPSASGSDPERKKEGADAELSAKAGSEAERASSDDVGAGVPDGPQTGVPDGPQTDASAPSSVGSADIFPPEGGRTVGAGALGGPLALAPDAALTLPTLSRDDFGEAVRAAQLLLIGRGCSCGRCGADADFGPDTRAAVLRFQRQRSLKADGVIGGATWRALLGVGA